MNPFFVGALDVRAHPINNARKTIRTEYITAITYIVEKALGEVKKQELVLMNADCDQHNVRHTHADGTKYHLLDDNYRCLIALLTKIAQNRINEDEASHVGIAACIANRFEIYRKQLFSDIQYAPDMPREPACYISAFVKPWRSKYLYMLVCDLGLILQEELLIIYATTFIKECLPEKRQKNIDQIILLLHNHNKVDEKYCSVATLIKQYRDNRAFFLKAEKRVIVTANMSAGKSTLINALVGKPIARTSQEACTGNVCYLFNKPYEDGNVHLNADKLIFNATTDDLHEYDWDGTISIASHFTGVIHHVPRLCVIDTPGVDAALYKEHSKRTYDALLNDSYGTIIYVVSPTRLGTEAEKKHLKWIADNVRQHRVIFVLNKLDNYRDFSDSIDESILGLKADLYSIGFDNPTICPISAYFSFLLKMKMTGQALSEDERDEYALYAKKFMRTAYDLSRFYNGVQFLSTDSEEITLSKRSGLYGLEQIIYGG